MQTATPTAATPMPVSTRQESRLTHAMTCARERESLSLSQANDLLQEVNATALHCANTQELPAMRLHDEALLDEFATHAPLDEFGAPKQFSSRTEAECYLKRKKFQQTLSPFKRNLLLTGDPGFAFDPVVYHTIQSVPKQELPPLLIVHFEYFSDDEPVDEESPPPAPNLPSDSDSSPPSPPATLPRQPHLSAAEQRLQDQAARGRPSVNPFGTRSTLSRTPPTAWIPPPGSRPPGTPVSSSSFTSTARRLMDNVFNVPLPGSGSPPVLALRNRGHPSGPPGRRDNWMPPP